MADDDDIRNDGEAGQAGGGQIVHMDPVPAHILGSKSRFHPRLKGLAKTLHLVRELHRQQDGGQRIVRKIILERRRVEAGNMSAEGAGKVERGLHPALEPGIVIDMEQDRFHGQPPALR